MRHLLVPLSFFKIVLTHFSCIPFYLILTILSYSDRGQLSQLLQSVRQLAEVHATQSDPSLHPLSSQGFPNNDLSQSYNEMTAESRYTSSPKGSVINGHSDDILSAMSDEHNAAVATNAIRRARSGTSVRGRGSGVERMRSVGVEGDVPDYCEACSVGEGSLKSSHFLRSASKSENERDREQGRGSEKGRRPSIPSHPIFSASSSSSRDRDRRSDKGCINCDTCSFSSSPSKVELEVEIEDTSSSDEHYDQGGNARIRHKVAGKSSGFYSADRVMVNFRELLWYWREYYLRRGRDRLSIEFSSHIPFIKWNALVGKSKRKEALLSGSSL